MSRPRLVPLNTGYRVDAPRDKAPAVVGMRRNVVMVRGEFPQELQRTFTAMETNGNPWNLSRLDRELPAVAGARYNEAGMATVDG